MVDKKKRTKLYLNFSTVCMCLSFESDTKDIQHHLTSLVCIIHSFIVMVVM